MKKLSTGTVQVIRDSLHVAEQVLTNAGARDAIDELQPLKMSNAIDELQPIKTSDAHGVHKVIEMIQCARAICFLVDRGYIDTDTICPRVYDFTLDEYREAVQRLGIPVGGENQ